MTDTNIVSDAEENLWEMLDEPPQVGDLLRRVDTHAHLYLSPPLLYFLVLKVDWASMKNSEMERCVVRLHCLETQKWWLHYFPGREKENFIESRMMNDGIDWYQVRKEE